MASWWAGGETGAANEDDSHQIQTHYQVLSVGRDADAASIRAAYQREVLSCHPDKLQVQQAQEEEQGAAPQGAADGDDAQRRQQQQQQRFAAVQAAYAALRDPSTRAAYDAELARQAQMEAATQIVPAEELDLSEMDVTEEEDDETAGGGSGGAASAAAATTEAAAAAARRRREVATYPCRCGDLYRLPMAAAVRTAAAQENAPPVPPPPPPPPPSMLVQCRGCSNHALVWLV